MTTNNPILIFLLSTAFLVMIPIIGYYTVKLGTYANLRARDLYHRRHPHSGRKVYGAEEDKG